MHRFDQEFYADQTHSRLLPLFFQDYHFSHVQTQYSPRLGTRVIAARDKVYFETTRLDWGYRQQVPGHSFPMQQWLPLQRVPVHDPFAGATTVPFLLCTT
jgi:hypothetical protein